MLKLAIVVPTYDEAANVTQLLVALRDVCAAIDGVRASVLIVDDASPDGTADIAKGMQHELHSPVFSVDVVVRPKKDGLGSAYIAGFAQVLADPDTDLVLQMDADLSHDPTYLPQLIEEHRRGADMVVASRYLPGGGTPDWGLHRKILSRGGNAYIRLLLRTPLTDSTGAYCLYTRDLLARAHPETIDAKGYGFQIVLKTRASQLAQRLVEVPIVFMDRRHGKSKIPKSTLVRSFVLVARMRWRARASRSY
jgi:dolichol-phosphate mannosyltransferase